MQERWWIVPHVKWTVVTRLRLPVTCCDIFHKPSHICIYLQCIPQDEMISPKTLTIDKYLLNKTVSSKI